MRFFLSLLLWIGCVFPLRADVVRPALVEISVHRDGQVSIELRTSIEALLTGINGRWRNTQDAPQAAEYDALRVLSARELESYFRRFTPQLLKGIQLRFDEHSSPLHLAGLEIPPAGYTQVPRISLIRLEGRAPANAQSLSWYYPLRFGDNAVRVRQVDRNRDQWHWSQHQWIREDQPSAPFSLNEVYAQKSWLEVVWGYLRIGFEHIIPRGLDHILFILGIFLLSARLRPLLWQITMFTLAHTFTLGLAMAGYIDLPARIVEPLIALSIAYIGLENIYATRNGQPGDTFNRFRLPLVFGFGLLHGLGFAGALRDFGMPADDFLTALIAFNVGVECGQLSVILLAFIVVGFWFRNHRYYRNAVIVPGSTMIGLLGLVWTFQRIAL